MPFGESEVDLPAVFEPVAMLLKLVAVAPKGQWARLSPDGRNVNWATSDALADMAGQSTFHSNLVEIRRA